MFQRERDLGGTAPGTLHVPTQTLKIRPSSVILPADLKASRGPLGPQTSQTGEHP